jgi:hypothetical protein
MVFGAKVVSCRSADRTNDGHRNARLMVNQEFLDVVIDISSTVLLPKSSRPPRRQETPT